MAGVALKDLGREMVNHLAGATHSRRIYAAGSPVWQKSVEAVKADMDAWFASHRDAEGMTIALLGDGLAVSGVPIVNPPAPVVRLTKQIRARDVEIISFKKETTLAELETLLSFLAAEAAETAAVKGGTWLRERGVENIDIRHLKLTAHATGVESFRDVFRSGGQALGQEFQRAATRGTVDMGPIRELSKSMLGLVSSNMPIGTLLALRDRDDYTYVHSVNVGLLAGCQAAALGLQPAQVEEIGTAGLLHDIGKARVPEAILTKKEALTSTEQAMLNAHTLEGARLLISSQGGERLAAIVAAEHHRPGGVEHSSPPLLASQLIALADTLDILRSLRPFDTRFHLRSAITYMFERLSERFHPYLLARFATLCGFFVEGDSAHLSTGEVVKVVAPHPESARQPSVEVVDTALGSLAVGSVVDLARAPPPGQPKREIKLPKTPHFDNLDPKELSWLG